MKVVAMTAGVIGISLIMWLSIGEKEKKEAPPPAEFSEGIELNKVFGMRFYRSSYTNPIKVPYGTCMKFWHPNRAGAEVVPIRVLVKSSALAFDWRSLDEVQRLGDAWDMIKFTSVSTTTYSEIEYMFVKSNFQPCPPIAVKAH